MRTAALLLASALALPGFVLAQERAPKTLGGPDAVSDGEPEAVAFQATLSGVKQIVLAVSDIPKVFGECTKKGDVENLFTERFQKEKAGPKLGKGGDPFLPLFEYWLETETDARSLLRGATIPEGKMVIVPRMKITTFTPAPEGSGQKPTPAYPLEGNAVWWGEPKDCKEGLRSATQALLDRFFAEYRASNPGTRLPEQ